MSFKLPDSQPVDLLEGLGDSIYVLAVKALSSGATIRQAYPIFCGLVATVTVQVTLLVLLFVGAGAYPKISNTNDGNGQVQELQQYVCELSNATGALQAAMTSWFNKLNTTADALDSSGSFSPGPTWPTLNTTQYCEAVSTPTSHTADPATAVVLVFFVTACAMFTLGLLAFNEAGNAGRLSCAVAAYGGFLPYYWLCRVRGDESLESGNMPMDRVNTVLGKSVARRWLAAMLPVVQLLVSLLAYACGVLLMSGLQFSTDWVQIIVNSVAVAFVLEVDNKVGQLMTSQSNGCKSHAGHGAEVLIQEAKGEQARIGLLYSAVVYLLMMFIFALLLMSPGLILYRSAILQLAPDAMVALCVLNGIMVLFIAVICVGILPKHLYIGSSSQWSKGVCAAVVFFNIALLVGSTLAGVLLPVGRGLQLHLLPLASARSAPPLSAAAPGRPGRLGNVSGHTALPQGYDIPMAMATPFGVTPGVRLDLPSGYPTQSNASVDYSAPRPSSSSSFAPSDLPIASHNHTAIASPVTANASTAIASPVTAYHDASPMIPVIDLTAPPRGAADADILSTPRGIAAVAAPCAVAVGVIISIIWWKRHKARQA